MVDICLLGCGGGMPMPSRNLSALLINYKGRKILIDCGEGTQVSMRMVGWGFKSIDIICITHCHGDHIVGLPGLLATIGNCGRTAPLTIIGPDGIKDVVNSLRVIAKYLPYEVKIIENIRDIPLVIRENGIEMNEENYDKSEIYLKTIELEHSIACIGYNFYFKRDKKFNVEKALENQVPKILWNRLQKGKDIINYEGRDYKSSMVLGDERPGIKLSYITDSRPIYKVIEFIENSDLFICEGTYGSDKDIDKAIKNKHMTFREAAKLAKSGRCRKLMLTHFSPYIEDPNEYDCNAKEEFDNVVIGFDRYKETLRFQE